MDDTALGTDSCVGLCGAEEKACLCCATPVFQLIWLVLRHANKLSLVDVPCQQNLISELKIIDSSVSVCFIELVLYCLVCKCGRL